jgi:hypothetical protein
MAYDVGDLVRLTVTYTNSAGSAVDPSTVTLAVKSSAGTTAYTYAAGSITKSSTGVYYKDVMLTVAGQWDYTWTSTGTPQQVATGTLYALTPATG